MRAAWMAPLLALSGCSWLFQEHLEGGYIVYDARSEPRCDKNPGITFVLDAALTAIGLAQVAAGVLVDGPKNERAGLIAGGAGQAVLFGASAATGIHWTRECGRAYHDWNQR